MRTASVVLASVLVLVVALEVPSAAYDPVAPRPDERPTAIHLERPHASLLGSHEAYLEERNITAKVPPSQVDNLYREQHDLLVGVYTLGAVRVVTAPGGVFHGWMVTDEEADTLSQYGSIRYTSEIHSRAAMNVSDWDTMDQIASLDFVYAITPPAPTVLPAD